MPTQYKPPLWWKDAQTLRHTLHGAWQKVSAPFFGELRDAYNERNTERAQQILGRVDGLGPAMVDAVGKKSLAILALVQTKADRAWKGQIRKVTKGEIRTVKANAAYQAYIAKRIDDQVNAFLLSHPGLIVAPEIQAQIDYLKTSDLTTSVDIADLLDRLEQTASQDSYFDSMTDVQVSRLWHANGVLMARDQGIKRGVITGPIDAKTCPVCRRLVGMEFDINGMADAIDAGLGLEDRDAYVAAWPFPRLADVDNISRGELAKKGFFPPFHPWCRHTATLLSR